MPAFITAEDLQYKYAKSAIPPDDPRRTGVPDSTLLNRGEQYEILDFLNRFATNTSYGSGGVKFGKAEALKAERMIHTGLPGDLRSHANVSAWLRENWSKY
ncbi:MAG: hypothetical protein Q7T70_16940 [Polaromonas sp.]|nr:hypothetical protein [Polaromonas sp.]